MAGGEFRKKLVREIVVQVEPGQVPAFLLFHLVQVEFGKNHAPFRLVHVGQGEKTQGPQPFFLNFLRFQGPELLPGHPGRQLRPYPFLDI